ncbi:porin [Simiduia curdlanivorans]|uniref:Porin n=1 Tax=Simiduia curdlanivorans TaxID=1492769 RepID=A0ABV8V6N8_9GAMM|nr:porin [Simiduia curdlanivorans]MDN3640620.1 porin [Simiduia curdlanivorans]
MQASLKKVLPFAIAAVLPMAAQAEGPIDGKIYGKINLSVENQDEAGVSTNELQSNASRLGFAGKTALSDSLSVIYQLEYEVDPDSGTDVFKQRNSYVGLAGGFGSVIAGVHDTPTKLLQNKVDLFNDLQGDIKSIITKSEVRSKNTVMYATPEMGGFFAQGAYVMSEAENVDDGYSVAGGWENDTFYAGISYDTDVRAVDSTVIRGVVQATLGSFQLGLLAETDDTAGVETDGWAVSGQYKMGDWALKAQAGQSDISTAGGETYSLGADYKLAKNTKLFGFYTNETADSEAKEADYVGLGIEHKF